MKKTVLIILVLVLTLACCTGLAAAPEAKIGDTEYDTLQEAVDAARTADVITLLEDVTADSLTVTSKNISIAGEGKTLTLSGTPVVNGGAEVVFENMTMAGVQLSASAESMISLVDVSLKATVSLNSSDLYIVNGTVTGGIKGTDDSYITIKDSIFNGATDYSVEATDSTVEVGSTAFTTLPGSIKGADSEITIENSNFTGNTATAVQIEGGTLTVNGSSFSGNQGSNGGAVYIRNAVATFTSNTITGNSADIGGGIYADTGASLTVNFDHIYDNTATTKAADVYIDSAATAVSLPSVSEMAVDVAPRFKLDGWYEDAAADRYTLIKSFAGTGNTYVGDTVNTVGHSLKAGFTAYDDIQISKSWVDYDNQFNTRLRSVDVTLKDGAGATVELLALSGTGADAAVTISAGTSWAGTITPLQVANYNSGYTLAETTGGAAIDTYQMGTPVWVFTPDNWMDEGGTAHTGPSGIYTASMENVYKIPVTVAKIWDDADNKDAVRPSALNTQLTMAGNPVAAYTDIDLINTTDVISLSSTDGWKKTVYLLASTDYSLLSASEGQATGYTQAGKSITQNPDGSITVAFVNHHDLNVDASSTVSNANMVYIHYRVDKEWDWNGSSYGELPHPEITVILNGDGTEFERGIIPADARRARYTFFDQPKYKSNENDDLIDYDIKEDITDSQWVKIQILEGTELVDYWYSLDGKGRYKATYTEAQIDASTAPLSTVKGGNQE